MYNNSCPVPFKFNDPVGIFPIAMDVYLCLEGQSVQYPIDDGKPATSLKVHSICGAVLCLHQDIENYLKQLQLSARSTMIFDVNT